MLKVKHDPYQAIQQGRGKGFTNNFNACNGILTRCNAMVQAMQDIAASKGSVDGDDLKRAGFNDAEIQQFGSKAADIAGQQSVKTVRHTPSPAIAATQNISAQTSVILVACINTPPNLDTAPHGSSVLSSWQDYCKCVAAFKLHPWHPLRERCIACLAMYLGQLSLGQASRATIIRAVEANLRTVPLCPPH